MTKEEVMVSIGVDNANLKIGMGGVENSIKDGIGKGAAHVKVGSAGMIANLKSVVGMVGVLRRALMLGGILSAPMAISSFLRQYSDILSGISRAESALRKFAGLGQSMVNNERDSERRRLNLREKVKKMQAEELSHAKTMLALHNELDSAIESTQKKKRDQMFEEAGGKDRLSILEKEKEAIKKNIEANKDELEVLNIQDETIGRTKERDELRVRLATSLEVLSGKQADNEMDISREKERQLELEDRLNRASKNLSQAGQIKNNLDDYRPTVEKLASMPGWAGNIARKIQNWEKSAVIDISRGKFGWAEEDVAEAKRLRGLLTDRGFIKDDTKIALDQFKKLEAIYDSLSKNGIVIQDAD